MNLSRTLFLVVIAFVFYFVTAATVSFLPDIFEHITKSENLETKERLEEFAKNDYVKNGLSALLSVITTIIASSLTTKDKDDSLIPVPSQKRRTSDQKKPKVDDYRQLILAKLDSLKGDYNKIRRELDANAKRLLKINVFARKKLRSSLCFAVVISFSLSHLLAAGIQSVARMSYPIDMQVDPLKFVLEFSQSICLAAFAFIFSFYFFRRYHRLNRSSDFESVFIIGFCGIFCAGLISLTQERPEEYVLLTQNVKLVPYFEIPMVTYFVITKLVVFPVIGLAGAAMAGACKPPRLSSEKRQRRITKK